MSPLRLLCLLATVLPTSLAAHAAPIVTTDYVVFTFTTAPMYGITVLPGEAPVVLVPGLTQQYSFSFLDGSVLGGLGGFPGWPGGFNYSAPITAFPGSNTPGVSSSGFFNLSASGNSVDFSIASSNLGAFDLSGSTASPIKSVGSSDNLFTTLFFQPGTYTLANPGLLTGSTVGPVVSASYTITQDGPAIPPIAPVAPPPALSAVTPEPSSLTLLGTGMLGIAGVLRRRLRTWAV